MTQRKLYQIKKHVKRGMNMRVKQLIKELKKYPDNCKVGLSMHDNSENEVAGLLFSIRMLKKEEIKYNYPDEDCVVLSS